MMASLSVGSMSFCRKPFKPRPNTEGSSRNSSAPASPAFPTRVFAAAMPARCAAAAAAAISSSSLKRCATGSFVSVPPSFISSQSSSSPDGFSKRSPSFFRRAALAALALPAPPAPPGRFGAASTRSRKCTKSVNVACASGFVRTPVGSHGSVKSWSRGSIQASVNATLSPIRHPPSISSPSSPPASRRFSLAHLTHSASHRMKQAWAGCLCPNAWNRLHSPMISASFGKWSSQNARGHDSHRKSIPPTAALLRPHSAQAWCGHPHRAALAISPCVIPTHSACTETGHRSQQTMSPPSQQDWHVYECP
mmetsp:Transcript_10072/g.33317  ORF Transcript_10072/g.33317 Transcript_10072/m.33317 type:complete len:308 (+) Transcript_10072:2944-3867(+)